MDSISKRIWIVLWLLGFTAILSIHVMWEYLDESTPVWDMAYHQLQGWRYLAAWQDSQLFERFAMLSTYYPPLYYLQEAIILKFLPGTQFLAWFSNLTGMALLSYSSYRLAALLMKPYLAVATGLLPLLFPMIAWTSRVSLLDLPLCGWVALSGYLLIKSNSLQKRSWACAFGLVCAAGSLTKWTFVLFLLFPLVHIFIYSPNRKITLNHLILATTIASPFVLFWYLPNMGLLIEHFQVTAQAAVGEGDPGWSHFLGWIYYPRSFASYYLYLPLAILGVWGLILREKPKRQCSQQLLQFLRWWLLGGILVMTLLPAKDPRYIMPLACPLAILLVAPWRRRDFWIVGIFVLAFLQFISISFLILPLKVVLFDEEEKNNYRSVRQEWVLYQTDYFDILGPPSQEDWKTELILDAVGSAGRIGFVPNVARFNPTTFRLSIAQKKMDSEIISLGELQTSFESLAELDFVIGKTGPQGMIHANEWAQSTYNLMVELDWPLVKTWLLPDQSQAKLWKNPHLVFSTEKKR